MFAFQIEDVLVEKSVSLLKDKKLDQIKHLCAKRKGILAVSPI